MRINHNLYQDYIKKVDEQIHEQNMFSPILLNNETLVFNFANLNESLIISLNNKTPLVFLYKDNNFYSSFENKNFLKIKKEIGKSIIDNIKLKNDDNILIVNLTSNIDIIVRNLILYIELFPNKPNFILCKNNNEIICSYFNDDSRNLSEGTIYNFPTTFDSLKGDINVDKILFDQIYKNEIIIRNKQKYIDFNRFITNKIKSNKRKISNIENDVKKAQENLLLKEKANEILCLQIPLKNHIDKIDIFDKEIILDKNKTILENVELMFKKAKKAKETISLSNKNIENAKEEISYYEDILKRFNESSEYQKDKIVQEIGQIKKKKEIKETPFNKPYKINYNGTIIYFGKNASQNDYLSFVMKLDREFTWLHIKDISGSHIIICNKNPTEKELILASEIALINSKMTSGQITYTKKKNVRRGHFLGEAILKNYSVIKINNISNITKEILKKATR